MTAPLIGMGVFPTDECHCQDQAKGSPQINQG